MEDVSSALLLSFCFINIVFCLNPNTNIVNNNQYESTHKNTIISSTTLSTPNNHKGPRNILDLNYEEKKTFLDSFDLFLSDCDGVLWSIQTQIDGSGKAVNLIKEIGKRAAFITNNSIRSEEDYLSLFREAGIDVDISDVLHPAQNIAIYLKKIKFDGLIYCIGTETFINVLKNAGFKVIDGPNEIIKESFTVLASHVFDKQPVKAVIIDFDFNVSGPKLIRAQMYLVRNSESILLFGGTDMFIPVRPGINLIGPGNFGKIVAESSGKKPIVLGKPGIDLCKIIMDRYNIKNPNRTLMVGDMLEQDIGFGKACGFQTLAVLSGGCKKEDFDKSIYSDVVPDYYADSLADFIEFFHKLKMKL